jgi:hypothetical protein
LQARPNFGQQLGVALADFLGVLTRVENYLEQVARVTLAGHRWDFHRFSPIPRRGGGLFIQVADQVTISQRTR